jgi:hypothetical protein
MPESDTDFGHAGSELTASPWPAHLAGGSALITAVLAWVLIALVAPHYLAPYAEQGLALAPWPQLVLGFALAMQGPAGWGVLAFLVGGVLVAWRGARRSGGARTLLLFGATGVFTAAAALVVLACGSPTHSAQDVLQQR